MSQGRPALTLKFGAKKEPAPDAVPTPSSAGPKLKIKFGGGTGGSGSGNSSLQAPAPQSTPTSTSVPATAKPKPGRKTKPTAKKRALEPGSSEASDAEASTSQRPKIKKIKLNTKQPTLPVLHLKTKGKIPKRPKGVGYDSEADDRELDPTISECIILRMQPGEDCNILRKAISENNLSRKQGGVDVRLRFLRSDGRRAIITIQGRQYAACLVDLPCVIEAQKSWFPKQGWVKSADVCQMLIVMGRVEKEEDAMTHPLPGLQKGELDEKTWQWAHGLTPPLRWVRKRRFRRRVSVNTVMEVEAEVEEQLRKDVEAEGRSIVELIDERNLRRNSERSVILSSEDQDAEGDDDDLAQTQLNETIEDEGEGGADDEEDADASLAAELEAGMMDDFDDFTSPTQPLSAPLLSSPAPTSLPVSTPHSPPSTAALPLTPSAAATPTVGTSSAAEGEEAESSEEEDDDDNEDDDADEVDDEDDLERQQEVQRQKEEIADLETAIKGEQAKAQQMTNALLKRRVLEKIKSLQGDLELKRTVSGIGEGGIA
ncbi:hypothetical protein MMC21_008274 [Puttea exsequens]|nr:hypothetical protein [Puttea exsequens]